MTAGENEMSIWQFYHCEFEYEEIFPDIFWPWAGHKYFAYDLIRNLKPEVLVELGTHQGTSFFSFCQGVKDAGYEARLYAVDTWRGDEHAGFYDNHVFEEVKSIKEKYYSRLKIELLRKSFDEAADEFTDASIDLLHIDGLHTYAAVAHDFKTWFPKVKPDGMILLHDIFVSRSDFGVYKLWEELKRKYKTIEFHQSYGLGILFKDPVRYSSFPDEERAWQIRYSCMAEDRKNEEAHKFQEKMWTLLADREDQIARLTAAARCDQKLLADRDEQIARLVSSSSWKLTAPYRWFGERIRRMAPAIRGKA